MKRYLQVAGTGLAVCLIAMAQSTTQSIQGLVTDSSGAVVVGARVTLTNEDTGVSRTAVTNNTGNYSFPLVTVGRYDLKIEMAGFKTDQVKAPGGNGPGEAGLHAEVGTSLKWWRSRPRR
jgi:hypothetical protein